MIKVDIITIFPTQIKNFINEGIFRIANKKEIVNIQVHNLRDWTSDRHKTVDDHPFGGGPGMLLKIEPIYNALEDLRSENSEVWVTHAGGEVINQKVLHERSIIAQNKRHIILIAGHYEGIDSRVLDYLSTWNFSIGKFILSGGELAVLVLLDGIIRLIPGVLGNANSLKEESYEDGFIEYPQYTRPAKFKKWSVPEVLLSGNHKKINEWREKNKKSITP